MAKYDPSITGALSGSIGAITYTKNRYGYYAKAKPIPTNRNTPAQATIRSFMRDLVAYWKDTMTSAESDAWEHAADLHKRNKWGSGFSLSGINLFTGFNILMLQANQAMVTEPTIFQGSPGTILPVIGMAAGTGELEIKSWAETEANIRAMAYFTDAVAQTIHYRNRPFVFKYNLHNATIFPCPVNVVYPGSGTAYRVFWGIKFFDIRGAVASMVEGWSNGTIV